MTVSPSRAVRAIELALFVVALLVSGLVVLALAWSGTGPYEDIMNATPVRGGCLVMLAPSGRDTCVPLARMVQLHQGWASYETGATADPPRFSDVRFTDDEYSHMADVRGVFDGAKLAAAAGALVILIRLQRARARGARDMWHLVRSGSVIAAGVVVAIGLVAIVAFEPLFLLFHNVFFPQGNFLFDPATSNIVRLYPDWYWEGITLRVGLSFVAAALSLAALSTLRLARPGAIDSPR